MLKKYLIVSSLILSSVLVPSLSIAVCTQTGVVVRVTAYDDSSTTVGGYIYFRTASLASSYYVVSTDDDDMISNAIAYMNSGRSESINGTATPCPAAPAAGGSANLGALNWMYNP